MSYLKKELNGKYLNWYNILSLNNIIIPSNINYSKISDIIKNLDWEGNGKDAICNNISSFDNTCLNLLNEISYNIQKLQKCSNIFNNLELLKNKYIEYNALIDEYDEIQRQILEQQNSDNGNGE